MAADVVMLRSTREKDQSRLVREKAEADAAKLQRIAADIRRMTDLYRQRLEGRQ